MIETHKIPVKDGVIGACIGLPDSDSAKDKTPLIYINGGPGGTYLGAEKNLLPLMMKERRVILYDQLGSYHSPASFGSYSLSMTRYVDELKGVLDYFQIERAILVGHSFGGTIAADFSLTHPDRVAGVMFSSALLSTPRWIADANRLLEDLPETARSTIRGGLSGDVVDAQMYDAAERQFYARHVCRLDPWPATLLESFSRGNKELYEAMWGRSEFVYTGTLKDYERFDDLYRLTMPVLVTCGRYDEATPETMAEAAARIKSARLFIFEKSSHTPMYEEPDLYFQTIRDFCNEF